MSKMSVISHLNCWFACDLLQEMFWNISTLPPLDSTSFSLFLAAWEAHRPVQSHTVIHTDKHLFKTFFSTKLDNLTSLDNMYWDNIFVRAECVRTNVVHALADVVATKLGIILLLSFSFHVLLTFSLGSWDSGGNLIWPKLEDSFKKIRNETQGPHVFLFTLLVMLGTMNLLALLP